LAKKKRLQVNHKYTSKNHLDHSCANTIQNNNNINNNIIVINLFQRTTKTSIDYVTTGITSNRVANWHFSLIKSIALAVALQDHKCPEIFISMYR